MPRILITTEAGDAPDAMVMLSERIATSDLASGHFAAHLIERIRWALADAESTESSEHQLIEQREPARRDPLAGSFAQAQLLRHAQARPA